MNAMNVTNCLLCDDKISFEDRLNLRYNIFNIREFICYNCREKYYKILYKYFENSGFRISNDKIMNNTYIYFTLLYFP